MNSGTAGSRILALGHYLPARVVTNDELATTVDTSDEWIRTRVGISERRIAAPDESVADMATAAAAKTLARSGLDSADVDLVVVATATAVDRMPNVAARVASQLGIRTPATFDVNVACSGFCYALALADLSLRGGAAEFSSDRAVVAKANVVIDLDAQGYDMGDALMTLADHILASVPS